MEAKTANGTRHLHFNLANKTKTPDHEVRRFVQMNEAAQARAGRTLSTRLFSSTT